MKNLDMVLLVSDRTNPNARNRQSFRGDVDDLPKTSSSYYN
jgi:hypothetical protein